MIVDSWHVINTRDMGGKPKFGSDSVFKKLNRPKI